MPRPRRGYRPRPTVSHDYSFGNLCTSVTTAFTTSGWVVMASSGLEGDKRLGFTRHVPLLGNRLSTPPQQARALYCRADCLRIVGITSY